MAETLWNTTEAAHYLHYHRPCNSIEHAHHLISCWIEDGTLSSWVRLDNEALRLIDSSEYYERGAGEYTLRWSGWGNLAKERYMGFVGFLVDAEAVQGLCPLQPAPKGPGGRPPKPAWDLFYAWVIHLAERPDGLPDDPAELRRIMLEWCEANMPDQVSETSIREKVKTIYELRAILGNNSR